MKPVSPRQIAVLTGSPEELGEALALRLLKAGYEVIQIEERQNSTPVFARIAAQSPEEVLLIHQPSPGDTETRSLLNGFLDAFEHASTRRKTVLAISRREPTLEALTRSMAQAQNTKPLPATIAAFRPGAFDTDTAASRLVRNLVENRLNSGAIYEAADFSDRSSGPVIRVPFSM